MLTVPVTEKYQTESRRALVIFDIAVKDRFDNPNHCFDFDVASSSSTSKQNEVAEKVDLENDGNPWPASRIDWMHQLITQPNFLMFREIYIKATSSAAPR
jgi:hypothetical protein